MATEAELKGWKPANKNSDDLVFDLDRLNMLELVQQLERLLSAPIPRSLFFKDRHHRKIQLEHSIIIEKLGIIQSFASMANELAKLKATLILADQITADTIYNYEIGIARERELGAELHETSVAQLRHHRKMLPLQYDAEKLKLLQGRIGASLDKARVREAYAKAGIITEIMKNINLKDMPQALQTYIVTSIINPNGSQFEDLEMREQIKQYVGPQLAAHVRQLQAGAKKLESDAMIAEANAKHATGEILNLIKK